jgi:hypothetical protein
MLIGTGAHNIRIDHRAGKTTMTTKLRVKIGALELDYEGTEEFVSSGLMPLIEALKKIEVTAAPIRDHASGAAQRTKGGEHGPTHRSELMSTSTIAQKMKGKKGPSLALAAVARLVIVGNKQNADRSEILQEMKGASAYYKDSYSANLTTSLQSLVTSGKLNDLGSNRYALHADTRTELEKLLAE